MSTNYKKPTDKLVDTIIAVVALTVMIIVVAILAARAI